MNTSVGAIEFKVLADLGQLRRDMDSAKSIVRQGSDAIGGVMGALGLSLSAAAFGAWIKSAIDAGDEMHNLAQKTGIATKDLAGIQLAFKQGGVDAGGLQTAMVKLAKNVSEGSDAFGRIGVNVRNTDGSLKSSKQVLYEVADVFKTMPEDMNRTALATDLFGKAGADLIPTLVDGSDGLREMAEMADKLGLTMDAEAAAGADKFNDTLELVGLAGQGVARQVATQLLPTLNALVGSMLDNVTSGDRLKTVANVLGAALKGLFSVGVIGVEVFNTVGKAIGGTVGAVLALAKGEFRQAQKILEESGRDIVQGWGASAKTISDAWTGAGEQTTDQALKMTKAIGGTTVMTKEQAEASKKAASEEAKRVATGQAFLAQLNAKYGALQKELSLGRVLTDGEKEMLKLEEDLADGKMRLTDAEVRSARAKLDEMDATRELRKATEEATKATDAAAAARVKEFDAVAASVDKTREEVAQQRAANEQLRTGVDASTALAVAKLREAAASADRQAVVAMERTGDEALSQQLREQANALRDLADVKEASIGVKAAVEARKEWEKTTDSIANGMTDALMRAFETGKGFWVAFRDTLVNSFKTLVLQPTIKAIISPVAGMVGQMFGAPAQAAGGAGGAGGAAGSLGSLLGGLSSFSNFMPGLSAGFGALTGEAGFGGAMSAANVALGAGNIGGGLGTAVGALGPYAIAALALYAAYKKWGGGPTPHRGSVVGVSGSGASTLWGDSSTILNNYEGTTDAALRGLGGASVGGLNALAGAFGGARNFGATLKFAADGKDASIGDLALTRGGASITNWTAQSGDYHKYSSDRASAFEAYTTDVASATRAAVDAIDLPQWAREQFAALGEGATIEQLNTTVQAVADLQQGLVSLQQSVAPLGGVFGRVAGLSSDALLQLTQFAGGISALNQAVAGYVSNYYSQAEQAAIQAASVQQALSAAGIDAGALSSRQAFRSLVDATDVSTEQGRRQLAALLGVQGNFAAVADVLASTGGTLGSLAATAPQGQILGNLMTDQSAADTSTPLLQGAVDHLSNIGGLIGGLIRVTQDAAQQTVARLDDVVSGLADITAEARLADLRDQATYFAPGS